MPHGNPSKYDPLKVNSRNGIAYGELYKRTQEYNQHHAGYTLVTIWESEWYLTEKKEKQEKLPTK